jgi:SAM-dependent methyltransferase
MVVTVKIILASDKERGVPELDRDTARAWIERWDRQQEDLLPDREDRFTALIDAVEAAAGRPDPLVLDLGCGPGSLAVRLLARLPRATVIAMDADPVTLSLGRAAYGGLPGLRFADVDLRAPGWAGRLGLERQPDAAVSTTALHWLSEPALHALYAELAGTRRAGPAGGRRSRRQARRARGRAPRRGIRRDRNAVAARREPAAVRRPVKRAVAQPRYSAS